MGDGSRIAYKPLQGREPAVVFLGGFTSDMTGTKARTLESHCREKGRAYVRFDYTGHGASSGTFREGTISRWASDALAVIDRATEGPVVLVGSSMGGWIMILAALARPERICGLVGVASAPDFSEDLIWANMDDRSRGQVAGGGVAWLPNLYGDEPTPVTADFLEDGRRCCVLGGSIQVRCPVRLFHGLDDPDVPWETSLRLARALESPDVLLTLVKGGGHRLSEQEDLARLLGAVEELCERWSSRRV